MTEITQADRDAAAEAFFCKPLRNEKHNDDRRVKAFARHRKYGYDQGYYDGRQFDRMEERAAIVAWLRDDADQVVNADSPVYGADIIAEAIVECAAAIEAGEHLK